MLMECLLLISVLFIIYDRIATSYWKRRGVFSVPGEFFFGNTRKIIFLQTAIQDFFEEVYKKHKDKKLIGCYNFYEPFLIVTDLEFVKRIFISDFNSFSDQMMFVRKKNDPLINYNPFISTGEEWRSRRAIHIPMQTTARMKEAFPTMMKNAQMLVDYVKDKKSDPVMVEDIGKFYTMDNVCSIFYGLEASAFKNPENGFRKHAYKIFKEPMGLMTASSFFLPILYYLFPLRMLCKELEEFFYEMAAKTMDYRKNNNINRNDLVSHLLKLDNKLKSEGKPGFTHEENVGNFFTTYLDSVETSTVILSFTLLELANDQNIQEKLRREVLSVGTKIEDFDYEKINSITYLAMIFDEILRLHPLLYFFSRTCTMTTQLGDVTIDKGTKVFIPNYSMQLDPEYFPDPKRFDPERFSEDNKTSLMKSAFYPFGEGPRQCLGMKFALLQMKMAVVSLILNFKLLPSKKLQEEKKVGISKDKNFLQQPEKKSTVIFQSL